MTPTSASPAGTRVLDLAEHRRRAEQRDRWRLQRVAAELLPAERVSICQRCLTRLGVAIEQIDGGRCEYAGVLTCNNRWSCPLCAAKLTERDRKKLQRAMTLWARDRGAVYLMTQTFRHDVTLPISEGIEKMQLAQKRMKADRRYKAIMRAAGSIGAVKALEVTLGENGWHPHTHTLIFARPSMESLLEGVRELWAAAVQRVGLGRVNEHGFDLRGGDYAAEYVAKYGKEPSEQSRARARAWWTASHELTKGHTKQTNRLKGATPFTLLRWCLAGDSLAGRQFQEYARAFKGRAQLYWSPRLAARIDLLELREPQAEAPRRERVLELEREDWAAILRHNARWEVLYVCEHYGGREAWKLIELLRAHRGRWPDTFQVTAAEPWPRPSGFVALLSVRPEMRAAA